MTVTVEQRDAALAKANGVRHARAELKRSLLVRDRAESRLLAAAVLDDPDDIAERMDIGELLKSVRGFGPTRVRMVLRTARVSEWRKVGSLTDRERGELADVLRGES